MRKFMLPLMLIFFAVSCQKKEQINKNLAANGGKWNIESTTTLFISDDPDQEDETITETPDVTLEFNKDGFGLMSQPAVVLNENVIVNIPFEYTNTEDVLILNFLDDNFEVPNALGPSSYMALEIIDWKKNELELYNIAIDFEDGYKTVTESRITLKKKK